MKKEIKLKPCPFCGSGKVEIDYFCGPFVTCTQCDGSGSIALVEGRSRAEAEADAIAAWNMRAATPEALSQRILELAADLSDAAETVRELAAFRP